MQQVKWVDYHVLKEAKSISIFCIILSVKLLQEAVISIPFSFKKWMSPNFLLGKRVKNNARRKKYNSTEWGRNIWPSEEYNSNFLQENGEIKKKDIFNFFVQIEKHQNNPEALWNAWQ